jgi:hypothetical protein
VKGTEIWLEREEEERVEVKIKEKRGKLLLRLEESIKTPEGTSKEMRTLKMMKNNGQLSLGVSKQLQHCLDLALGCHKPTSPTSRTLSNIPRIPPTFSTGNSRLPKW